MGKRLVPFIFGHIIIYVIMISDITYGKIELMLKIWQLTYILVIMFLSCLHLFAAVINSMPWLTVIRSHTPTQ